MRPVKSSPFAAERNAADFRTYDASSPRVEDHDMRDEGVRLALIYRGRGEAKIIAAALERKLHGESAADAAQSAGMVGNRAPVGSGLASDRKRKASPVGKHRSWRVRGAAR